jgi:DNA helicase IV
LTEFGEKTFLPYPEFGRTKSGVHPELAAEQAHVDRAYDRLAELEEKALALAHEERTNHSRTFAAMLERDVRERAGLRRRASLRLGSLNLCFGRIDREDGATYHLGRVAVADEDQEPLIVDWRAPIAEPFYRATSADPLGLRRRRHLITKGRQVLRLDDELLGEAASGEGDDGANDDLVLVGEAALLDALRRARTGRMGDIVSTIQAEQDRIIRAPLGGLVVVQGGPGTGKSAVALHRAAYLLYTHRFPLEEMGVLFVGPNPVFLRYIERVLPTLGESGCRMAVPDELVDDVRATRDDDPEVVRLKGDVRMAEVVARAVRSRQRPSRRVVAIPFGAYELKLGPRKAAEIVERVGALPGTHNARRPLIEREVYTHLRRQYAKAVARAEAAGMSPRALEDEELTESLRGSRDVRRLLDRLWPVLSPARLLDDLLGLPALLGEAADGLLSAEEQRLLVRDRTPSGETPTWSVADLALLDEAAPLLGPTSAAQAPPPKRVLLPEDISAIVDRALADQIPDCPNCGSELTYVGGTKEWRCGFFDCGKDWHTREVLAPAAADLLEKTRDHLLAQLVPKGADRPPDLRTYGHVVVDEAQDLSPMQWRMLARRCPSGSMTIVGDLGQASGHWAPASWQEVIDLVPAPRSSVVELTVNYRTPSEVMDVAARVLAEARPDLTPARSVRDAGVSPRAVPVSSDDVVAAAVEVAAEELAAVDGGKVAVIVPVSLLSSVAAAIAARSELAGVDDDVLSAPVSPLTLDDAKGLEFDSVVVVDPSAIAAEHPHGLGALYVALTRTTTRLALVHAGALPTALAV